MRVICAIRMEQVLKTFKSMIASVVPVNATVSQCIQVRAPTIFEKNMTVIACPFVFLVRLVLPLSLLVFELLKRIKVKPYQRLPKCWHIIRAAHFLIYTQNLKLGFNELFHLYSLRVRNNWFDFVPRKGKRLLAELPTEMEMSWTTIF